MWKKCDRVVWEICVKYVFENCVEKVVGLTRLNTLVNKFGSKFALKIVWNH